MRISGRFDVAHSVGDKGIAVETHHRVINGNGYEFYRQINPSGFRLLWVFKNDGAVPVHEFKSE